MLKHLSLNVSHSVLHQSFLTIVTELLFLFIMSYMRSHMLKECKKILKNPGCQKIGSLQ